MTTGWLLLLLLLVVVSSQTVDSQLKNDDEKCRSAEQLSKLQSDTRRLLENQQQLFQQLNTVMNRFGKSCNRSKT